MTEPNKSPNPTIQWGDLKGALEAARSNLIAVELPAAVWPWIQEAAELRAAQHRNHIAMSHQDNEYRGAALEALTQGAAAIERATDES